MESVPLDFLGDLRRTHTCGELRASDAGKTALIMGWVHRRRDLGGVVFIHLRDRDGVTQLVFHANDEALHAKVGLLGTEYVIAAEGRVELRSADTVNPAIPTGEVEIAVEKLWILNESRTPPFPMEETVDVKEDARLKYRYVDLRRPHMQRNIILRSKISFAVRETLTREGLCASAIAADFQAASHGERLRQVFSDCPMLSRRGPARRSSARVHPDR